MTIVESNFRPQAVVALYLSQSSKEIQLLFKGTDLQRIRMAIPDRHQFVIKKMEAAHGSQFEFGKTSKSSTLDFTRRDPYRSSLPPAHLSNGIACR